MKIVATSGFLRRIAGVLSALALGLPGPGAAAPNLDRLGALAGTMVVEGGRSFALFRGSTSSWLVGEGDALADGSMLRRVLLDRIVIEEGGVVQEVFLFEDFPGTGVPAARRPAESLPPAVRAERMRSKMGLPRAFGERAPEPEEPEADPGDE